MRANERKRRVFGILTPNQVRLALAAAVLRGRGVDYEGEVEVNVMTTVDDGGNPISSRVEVIFDE